MPTDPSTAVTSIDWWAGAAGVVVGAFIPMAWQRYQRRVERRGELRAVRAEMDLVLQYARALQKETIAAPLYSLPTGISERAMLKLIGEGKLETAAIGTLVEYLTRVAELNRGLERARDAEAQKEGALLNSEFARNLEKARELCGSGEIDASMCFQRAAAVISTLAD